MADAEPSPFLHHIRHLLAGAPEAALSDAQLLERFLTHRDETAVEVLVRRYGPLVFGVCRRVLRNAHAAEDVFQATFLILTRKAPSLGRCKRLGGWLYTVAYRLALRARANEARRQRREAQASRNRPDCEAPAASPGDLIVALEEELQRLPERHRTPLILCYLEGKTNEDAAELLGCPRGSMSARLAQARERLRECLARRGYAVPSAGLATLLAASLADAAVPLPLLSATVRAALWFAGEQAGRAAVVSAPAVALARSACRAMFLHKLQVAAALLLVTALLGTGATMLLKAAPPPSTPSPMVAQPSLEAPPVRLDADGLPLPKGAIARMGTTRLRHGDAITFAAYTPDGKKLVTAGRDQTLRLWDLAAGKEVRRFAWGGPPDGKAEPATQSFYQRHEQQVLNELGRDSQAVLSADGKILAASRGGVVCLWDTATGKRLRRLETGQSWLAQLAFSGDGKSLVTLGAQASRELDAGQAVAVWEVATGKCLRRYQGKPLPGLGASVYNNSEEQDAVVSPGLKYLACQRRDETGQLMIYVSDLATGRLLARIDRGGFGGMRILRFSADDRALLWDHFPAADIVFTDVTTGKELRRVGHHRRPEEGGRSDAAQAVALSPDGKSLAVCRDSHTIEIWDVETGKPTYPVGKPTNADLEQRFTDFVGTNVRPALAFSPDGNRLLCSQGRAALRQFDAVTGKEIAAPVSGGRSPLSTLALSPDGKSLRTHGGHDAAHSWDWATGEQTGKLEMPSNAEYAVFAAGGRFAYAVGNQVTLSGPAGKKTWRIVADEYPPLTAFALSPDGSMLAARSWDHTEVRLWDANGKERLTLGKAGFGAILGGSNMAETSGVVTPDVVFSPDGRRLAAAGHRRQLCLWDTSRGTLLWEAAPEAGQAVERLAFSPGGHVLAAVQADHTVTLYEAASGARRCRFGKADLKRRRLYLSYDYYGRSRLAQASRMAAPVCVAFSPDGRYLAMARETPAIHLWDVLTGREVGTLEGHEGGVVGLLFTPDGKRLISAGTDTTALTWDLTRLIRREPARTARLSTQALDALWTDLAGTDGARAFAAVRKLCASPDQAVRLIQDRLRPATPADPKRLAALVAGLESDRYESRRRAAAELEGLGELAAPALRRALADDPPLDLRQRLLRLLRLTEKAPTGGRLRELRAIEVLERIDSPAARQVLRSLAGGATGARRARETKCASERLAGLRIARP